MTFPVKGGGDSSQVYSLHCFGHSYENKLYDIKVICSHIQRRSDPAGHSSRSIVAGWGLDIQRGNDRVRNIQNTVQKRDIEQDRGLLDTMHIEFPIPVKRQTRQTRNQPWPDNSSLHGPPFDRNYKFVPLEHPA